jgi:hypothetical protein
MEWKIRKEVKPKDGESSVLLESANARTKQAALVHWRPNP